MAYIFFPNPKPTLVDDLWFKLDRKVDKDVQLSREEEEFYKKVRDYNFLTETHSLAVSRKPLKMACSAAHNSFFRPVLCLNFIDIVWAHMYSH